ncbi:hypothetical protein, partial [Aeromicrobium alkaliterrae]|uniref:hypothetical protein n=1 Tax=Aeromicrobium alkaliterrae TaxID=302168 RepID=UPI0031D7D17D
MTDKGAAAARQGAIDRLRRIETELSIMSQLSFSHGPEISKAKFEAIGIAASHLGPAHHLVATMREVDTTETLVAFGGLQRSSV